MTDPVASHRAPSPAAVAAILTALVVGWSILVTSKAQSQSRADVSNEAETHYKRGVKLYQEGDYDEAVKELREAYALTPAPMLLYNIAMAEWRSGDLKAALEAGNRANSEGVPEAIRPKLAARLRAFESIRSGRDVAIDRSRAAGPEPRTDRSGGRREGLGAQGWVGISLAAGGMAALGGALGIDRHLASESEEFERIAARGDENAYTRKYKQIVRRQRTGLTLWGVGVVATSVGVGLLVDAWSGRRARSNRDRRTAELSVTAGIRRGGIRIEFW